MKIPKRFKLMGQTITITERETDFTECADRIAYASYRMNEIQFNPMLPYKSAAQKEHAFMHEMVHFILYYSGCAYKAKEDYMHQDEGFVDLTANLLHQALTSMEYE